MSGGPVLGRVVLFSGHYHQSRRRAGFHFLAEAYRALGWDVTFVTVSLSWLSVLRGDYRLEYPVRREAGHFCAVEPGLQSFVLFTPYHPANLRLPALNRVSAPIFRRYGRRLPRELQPVVASADLLVFESTPGLLLVDSCRAINPRARYVYRVSDDLRVLNNHPVVLAAERRLAPQFDLVSVPTGQMLEIFPGLPNVEVQPHGLEKGAFDHPLPNPYAPGGPNAVFVGNARLDYDFLERASGRCPTWRFHIIGPFANLPQADNIVRYGEMPFEQTLPYVQHADVGLHTLAYSPGAEVFRDSLKVSQYTYCGLGVVAPEFLRSTRSNVFCYHPGDAESIAAALDSAASVDRSSVDRSGIRSWQELATELAA